MAQAGGGAAAALNRGMQHHPILREFTWTAPRRDGNMVVNAIGARQQAVYDAGVVSNAAPFERHADSADEPSIAPTAAYLPRFDEEYFEWIDILESVKSYASGHAGKRPYVVAELGAGFGRWAVNAVQALRQACPDPCEYFLCAVEADRKHFEWLRQNLSDNGIDPGRHLLLNVPLTGDGRCVSFLTGAYGRDFGQSIIKKRQAIRLRATESVIGRMLLQRIAPLRRRYPPLQDRFVQELKSSTLNEVLRKTPHVVDIADLDLQEMEAEVIEAALPLVNERVKRMHIGTHSPKVEERLRECLRTAGWDLVRDYACHGLRDTPFGRIAFGDGVQSWINPRLVRD